MRRFPTVSVLGSGIRLSYSSHIQSSKQHTTKQDRQCTYNITLRRFCVTTVVVENQLVLHILSVRLWPQLSSKQCASALSSSVACPALPYFCTCIINGTIFQNVFEYKMCFDFHYNFLWNISHSKKNSAGYHHKCT